MPDRSSHQGLPEEWNHGSHAAPEPFAAPNGYGAATSGSHRARPADGYGTGSNAAFGTGPNAAFGAAKADPLAAPVDPLRASYGAGKPDAFGVRPGGTYGAGAADPFGDAADPFGARAGDPFGPATTAAFAAAPADAATARPDTERPTGAGRDSMAADRESMAAGRDSMAAGRESMRAIRERMGAGRDRTAGEAADTRGFLGALFDFGFTSFVTPSVIKVLYMLIMIGTVASALVFTIIVFKASALFGFLTLVFGDPLFILIVLAIYRIILEFFVVTFRVAEDVRALRERGGLN